MKKGQESLSQIIGIVCQILLIFSARQYMYIYIYLAIKDANLLILGNNDVLPTLIKDV